MAFNRSKLNLINTSTMEDMLPSLAGLGILVDSKPKHNVQIEEAIYTSIKIAMSDNDHRILSLLVEWLKVHSFNLNVSLLQNFINNDKKISLLEKAFWAWLAYYNRTDSRFKKIERSFESLKPQHLNNSSELLVDLKGVDDDFVNSKLIIPKGMLSLNKDWLILDPTSLSNIHGCYKMRLIVGPTFRADMWWLIESKKIYKASQIAKWSYGSYATAHKVVKDYKILNGKTSA